MAKIIKPEKNKSIVESVNGNKNVVLLAIVFSIIVFLYLIFKFFTGGFGAGVADVNIPKNSTFEQILDTLEVNNLIRSRASFKILATTYGKADKIKWGKYKIERGSSNLEVLDVLTSDQSNKVKVTFPEGITAKKVASILKREDVCDSTKFIKLITDSSFLRSINISHSTAEGFLMPDTYFFSKNETPENIVERMVGEFNSFYSQDKQAKSNDVNLTPYQVIILASIVEGEARVSDERSIIAGLYLNRIKKGIKLEADPTVQYIIPYGPRRLYFKDLAIDNPYNTYKYKGLPPSPINNPSKESILGVLHAQSHNYIFMCAKGDGSGRHNVSVNSSQHKQAVTEYQQNLKKVK
ncbi:MAG: endolytic transglycosylase MltG [Chlorobi bacterium]|nr:endolytic transglycosylase MltG [Chlorobiota bacterium]